MGQIADIRKEIARVLEEDTEISDTLLVHVYSSRQLPGLYDSELCVFSGGAVPEKGSSLGGPGTKGIYQYVILWLMKFENTSDLALVEDESDDLESAIYRVLLQENYSNPMWRRLKFPGLSLRPVAPGGTQNVHFGRTIVRINT